MIIGAGMAGGAVTTALVGARLDRTIGRRRMLVAMSLLSAAGYALFVLPVSAVLLVILAFATGVNGMGRDRGGLGTLEQAVLPETTTPERRTWTLAYYNVALDVGHAAGALAVGKNGPMEGNSTMAELEAFLESRQ